MPFNLNIPSLNPNTQPMAQPKPKQPFDWQKWAPLIAGLLGSAFGGEYAGVAGGQAAGTAYDLINQRRAEEDTRKRADWEQSYMKEKFGEEQSMNELDRQLKRRQLEPTPVPTPRNINPMLEPLSPKNPFRAMLQQPGLSNEQLDAFHQVGVKWDQWNKEEARQRAEAAKSGAPSTYKSTPLVQEMEKGYAQFLVAHPARAAVKGTGAYDTTTKTWDTGAPASTPPTMQQWILQTYGADKLKQYNAEKTGGQGPSTTVSYPLVAQYEGVATAILGVIADKNTPRTTKQELVDRYNTRHGTNYTLMDWAGAKEQGLPYPNAKKKPVSTPAPTSRK